MATDQLSNEPRPRAGASFANALRDNLATAILFVSARDESLLLSPKAANLLGTSPKQAPEKALDLPPPLLALVRQGLAGCPVTAREIRFSVNGQDLTVDLNVVLLKRGDEIEGVVLVLNDVAADRVLDAHLDHVNRLANAGTLAASMAHEIKNALVAGKTFVDLLLEKNSDNELVDVVRRELTRVDAIVGRMLRLSSPDTNHHPFAPVCLNEVLDRLLRFVQPELENQGVAVDCSLDSAGLKVNGDADRLQQAFLNLLLNSLEALGGGGRIFIRTELQRTGDGDGQPPQLRVILSDNGTGISPEHLKRVFEPFFTTKPTGTGLGLAITRRIIAEHGGTITVQSQPGCGAHFEILFPTCP